MTSIPAVRSTLATACARGNLFEACNALAYMEEAKLGGRSRSRDVVAHHLRACERGSIDSCTRLLTGPFARPRAPRDLDPDELVESMMDRCTRHDESACLALATAFETGWAVGRDRARAAEILAEACDDGMALACKRSKRRKQTRRE